LARAASGRIVPVMSPLAVLALLLAAESQAQQNAPFPPHRIADNLYYVGSKMLASYLVTTKEGHILINADFESTVPLLHHNVEALGWKWTDVKILLASHAHDDHVAGSALVRQQTGAKVFVMAGDDGVVRTGGQGQYLYKTRWAPCPVDRVLHDGDEVKLGAATLVARLTPGHTRGCTTWTMKVADGGQPHDAVIVCSPNINPGYRLVDNDAYPEIAADYAHSFADWRALPADIFLGAHGAYYDLEKKFARLGAGPNPFIDPTGYRAYIDERERNFRTTLEAQKKQKKK
jgi:metallo-beta-lactamase class B